MNKPSFLLSKSEFAEEYVEVLQLLEVLVARFYRQHPQMYDLDVLYVYEALLKRIKAKLTNFPLPQNNLKGVSNDIYVLQLKFLEEMENFYSLKEIQECLKLLEKSLKLWSREHGSKGYLNYIAQFIPNGTPCLSYK